VTRAELASLLREVLAIIDGAETVYTSRRGHGPPGYEHRRWQRIARAIGTKRGRWYVVTAEQLAAYEAARRPTEPAPPPVSEPATSSDALARRLGLRLVREG
jgi:hypothetical protein